MGAIDKLRITSQGQDQSMKWYREQVQALSNRMTPGRLMADKNNIVSRINPGGLYLYYYDPKTKDTLPYYDTFPLVYPYKKVKGGFYGYNLHYLPVAARMKMMGALMDISNSNDPEQKKLARAYGALNSASGNKYFMPCIKHYLTGHVMSNFLQIPEDAWLTAAILPIERFVGSKQRAWSDTLSRV